MPRPSPLQLLRRALGRVRPAPKAPPRPPPPPPAPYVPANPDAWRLGPGALHPRYAAALAAGPAALAALAEPVGPGLWALPVLSEPFCAALRAEVSRKQAWAAREGVELSAPNSMNRYGLILDSQTGDEAPQTLIDLSPLREALAPLAARLFPEHGGEHLTQHHGFVVTYTLGGDRDLAFHADDAEVTLNLCLGGGFEGGELYFEGPRCINHHDTPTHAEERAAWAHRPGVALLHAGANRHGALPLTAGRRDNLILWMRAGGLRAAGDARTGLEGCVGWCGVSAERVRGEGVGDAGA